MNTMSFGAFELALLIVVAVAVPVICAGGIGLAYRAQERASAKKNADRARSSSEEE